MVIFFGFTPSAFADQSTQYFSFQDLLTDYLEKHPEYEWGSMTPIPASELSNSFIQLEGSGFMTGNERGYTNTTLHTGNDFNDFPRILETTQLRMNFATPIQEGILNFFVFPDYFSPEYDSQRWTFTQISQQPKLIVELFGSNGESIGSYEKYFTSPLDSYANLLLKGDEQFSSVLLTYSDGLGQVVTGQTSDCSFGPIPGCEYYISDYKLPGHLVDLRYIEAVPEPETYLMMLAGLGLFGFRRKYVTRAFQKSIK
jgi:hypothetical protein